MAMAIIKSQVSPMTVSPAAGGSNAFLAASLRIKSPAARIFTKVPDFHDDQAIMARGWIAISYNLGDTPRVIGGAQSIRASDWYPAQLYSHGLFLESLRDT